MAPPAIMAALRREILLGSIIWSNEQLRRTTPTTMGDHHGTRPVQPAAGAVDDESTFRHSYTRDRAQLLRRLSRIEGQVRGIGRMIEREEYCVDILQQTAALRAAVDAVSIMVLEDHVQGCVRTAAERGEADRYVEEVLDVVRRTLGRPVRSTSRP
ncbi:MAG TPA: metal-sensitive transcriptional regulator [Patescibacteria group bacterium]|nr:metal-sensitive transcriptional regulator [Patescibacteria group bacterium]